MVWIGGRQRCYAFAGLSATALSIATPTAYGADFGVSFQWGHRSDDFYWNIADADGSPDVLSELTWNLGEVQELRVDAFLSHGNWILGLQAARGTVEEGRNQDSDYLGDGRTIEFSRSNNNSGGEISEMVASVGYQLTVSQPSDAAFIHFTPSLGYGRFRQYLTMTDGCQTIPPPADPSLPCTPFPNLQSSYDTQWDALTFGLDLLTGPKAGPFAVRLRVESFVKANYDAVADWNLKQNFQHPVSFSHAADGSGYRASVGLEYVLTGEVMLTATYMKMAWETEPGIDTTYFASGRVENTVLNEVVWDADSYLLGIGVRFR